MSDRSRDEDDEISRGSPKGEDEELALLDKHLAMLSEHYPNVHIFANRMNDDGSTVSVQRGIGNWHARIGQMKAFIIYEDERYRQQLRCDNIKESEAQDEDDD